MRVDSSISEAPQLVLLSFWRIMKLRIGKIELSDVVIEDDAPKAKRNLSDIADKIGRLAAATVLRQERASKMPDNTVTAPAYANSSSSSPSS